MKDRKRKIKQKISPPCEFLWLPTGPSSPWTLVVEVLESFFCRYHLYAVQVLGIHGILMPLPNLGHHVLSQFATMWIFVQMHYPDLLCQAWNCHLTAVADCTYQNFTVVASLMGTSLSDRVLRHSTAFSKSSHTPTG